MVNILTKTPPLALVRVQKLMVNERNGFLDVPGRFRDFAPLMMMLSVADGTAPTN